MNENAKPENPCPHPVSAPCDLCAEEESSVVISGMTIALAGALTIPACVLLVQLAYAHWTAANPLLAALLALFWTTLACSSPNT